MGFEPMQQTVDLYFQSRYIRPLCHTSLAAKDKNQKNVIFYRQTIVHVHTYCLQLN